MERLKWIVGARTTYGYRRATAVLNRERRVESKANVNHKRVYRLMRENRILLQRHTGKPTRTHDGKVVTLSSNLRWSAIISRFTSIHGCPWKAAASEVAA